MDATHLLRESCGAYVTTTLLRFTHHGGRAFIVQLTRLPTSPTALLSHFGVKNKCLELTMHRWQHLLSVSSVLVGQQVRTMSERNELWRLHTVHISPFPE